MDTAAATLICEAHTPGLVFAYRFDAAGRAQALAREAAIDLAPRDGFVWLHLNLADARACRWVAAHDGMSEACREALLTQDQQQYVATRGQFITGVVADLVRDFDQPSEQFGRLQFVLGPRFLCTGRRHALHGVELARNAIEAGEAVRTPVELIESLIGQAANGMEAIAAKLVDQVDDIEDRMLDNLSRKDVRALGPLRRMSVRLHRQLVGLNTVFRRVQRDAALLEAHPALVDAAARLAVKLDALDHEVTSAQERARLLHDEFDTRQAAQTNRHLYTLSILSALFLPATLITGLFGMNVGGLPMAEFKGGFAWATLLCGLASLAVYGLILWLARRAER